MADRVLSPEETRAAAAATLLARLEDLVVGYGRLPETQRQARLVADADRITAEVARHLGAARRQLGPARSYRWLP